MELLDCPIDGCTRTGLKGFSRRDNLIQHMRSKTHGESIEKDPYLLGREHKAVDLESYGTGSLGPAE